MVDLRCRTCVTGHFFTFCWCIWDLQAFWCRDQNWTVFSAKSKQRQGHEHDALRFFMPLKLKKQSQNSFVPNSAHSIHYLSLQLLLKMPVAKRNLATTFGAFWFVVRLLGLFQRRLLSISETKPIMLGDVRRCWVILSVGRHTALGIQWLKSGHQPLPVGATMCHTAEYWVQRPSQNIAEQILTCDICDSELQS